MESGPKRSDRGVESTMSQKSDVTCFLSLSAWIETSFWRANSLGVAIAGSLECVEFDGFPVVGLTSDPQYSQAVLSNRIVALQLWQARNRIVPHVSQRLRSSGLSP
jgi:hypothetical protein